MRFVEEYEVFQEESRSSYRGAPNCSKGPRRPLPRPLTWLATSEPMTPNSASLCFVQHCGTRQMKRITRKSLPTASRVYFVIIRRREISLHNNFRLRATPDNRQTISLGGPLNLA